jgi:hypothetical protein
MNLLAHETHERESECEGKSESEREREKHLSDLCGLL